MMAIDFLTLNDVMAIHRRLIDAFGGSDGVRDEGLLLSAMAMPQTAFFGVYAHNDLFEMAAAYLFHLVMNHPFVDGNKRTGAAAAIVFLGMNGFALTADNQTLVEFTLSVAQGKQSKPEITVFLKEHSTPMD
jgi:death-on-curing protein